MENIIKKKKGEITCNKQFLLFSQCFLPYMALIFRFKCTLKCRLQFVSISTSLEYSIFCTKIYWNLILPQKHSPLRLKFSMITSTNKMPRLSNPEYEGEENIIQKENWSLQLAILRYLLAGFCCICRRQCHYGFNTVF